MSDVMSNVFWGRVRAAAGRIAAARGNEATLHAQLVAVGKELEAARVRERQLEAQLGIGQEIEKRRASGTTVSCPSILFNAVPKSASTYCYMMIMQGLNLVENTISVNYFPKDMIVWKRLTVFGSGSQIAHHHIDASPVNIWFLQQRQIMNIVHVRDLRQVMISWTHHLVRSGERYTPLQTIAEVPEAWFDLPLERQFDWMIDNHLPVFAAWIQEWIDAAESGQLEVLFTTFEEFVADRTAFFGRIVRFCGLDDEQFQDPKLSAQSKPEFQFRKGDAEEWRSIFTPEQRRRATELMPPAFMERFGWRP